VLRQVRPNIEEKDVFAYIQAADLDRDQRISQCRMHASCAPLLCGVERCRCGRSSCVVLSPAGVCVCVWVWALLLCGAERCGCVCALRVQATTR
jgi:hypothetical protein